MSDVEKTKEQLIAELEITRRQIETLEQGSTVAQLIGDAIPDLILLVDEDGVCLDVISGIQNNRMLGPEINPNCCSIFSILPPSISQKLRETIDEAHRSNALRTVDYPLELPNDRKFIESRIKLVTPKGLSGKAEFIMINRDMSDRKEVEENLRNSENTYRTVVENISEGIVLADTSHRIISCNSTFAEPLGKKPEELIGMRISDLFSPEFGSTLIEIDDRVIATGETVIFSDEHQLRNVPSTFEATKSPARDDKGRIIGTITVTRDVTKIKETENQLRGAFNTYRTVVENIPQQIILKNNDHIILSCNSVFAREFGKTPLEIMGMHSKDLYPPEKAEEFLQSDEFVLRTGEPVTRLDIVRRSNGTEYYSSVKRPIKDDNGKIIGNLTIGENITERKRFEDALRFSDAALRSIRECVFAMDIDWHVTHWNHQCVELFGISEVDALGRFIGDLVQIKEDTEGQNARRISLLVEQGFNHEEQVYITPNGEIWLDVLAQEITRDGERTGWITLANDITERKKIGEDLRISEERFSKAFRTIPDAILITTFEEAVMLEINDSFVELSGYSREELLGRSVLEIDFWQDHDDLARVQNALDTNGRIERAEYYFRNRAGNTIIATFAAETFTSNGERYILAVITDITEKKKVEERLARSDAALRSIRECVYATDLDYLVTSWNHTCEQVFGISEADAIGKYLGDLYHIREAHEGENLERRARLVEHGYDHEEQVFVTRNGEIWMDSFAQSIEKDGIQQGWIFLANDITERKNIEESLRISEERFSKAFRTILDSIIITTMDEGLFIEANDSFLNLTGYSREELIGKTVVDIDFWADGISRIALIEELKLRKQTNRRERPFRKKSGEIGIGLVNVETMEIAGTECIIGIITDITERKKAEEQLRYQASLVENVTDAIISHDERMQILSCNKAAEQIFGIPREQMVGTDLRDLAQIQPVNTTPHDIRLSLETTGSWRGEASHIFKNGMELHMRISTIRIQDANPKRNAYIMIMSDITEEKKAQEELQRLYEREISLRQTVEDEMKKRIEFSAAIVHELKTPLTAIISSSDLLADSVTETSLKRLADNINHSAYDLDKRTNELLDMTRGEIGAIRIDPERCDIVEMISSLELEFKTMLAVKNISFTLEIPQKLPKVYADETRLRQVLYNLIDNANKFTGAHGSVSLIISLLESDILFEVRDTGLGLTVQDQKTVFEPYRQLIDGKRSRGGMGLGLAIARNLIQAHNGNIWVKSRKGKGSSFYFTIPLKQNEKKSA